jgi:hypothetical protein
MWPSTLTAALGIAIGAIVVLTPLAVPSFQGLGAALSPGGPPVALAPAPQSLHPLNATDCGLLSSSYITGTESAAGWPPSYANDTEVIWAKLCNDTSFVSLLAEWGGWYWFPPVTANGTTTPGYLVALNLSMSIGGSGPPSAWGNWTYFMVTWTSWASVPKNASSTCRGVPCRWSETWVGSLPGTNYTGPSLYIYTPFTGGGPPPPSPSGPAGPSAVAWLGPLLGAALAVGMAILAAVRVRTTRPQPPSGRLAKVEVQASSGLVATTSGRGPLEAPPGPPPQDSPLEPSDPPEDAL